jgi:toxin YoeB
MYKIVLTKQAVKDAKRLENSHLKENILKILSLIEKDPFVYPPEYEYLRGFAEAVISRRINKQHRLVHQVLNEQKTVKILRMWTHYE